MSCKCKLMSCRCSHVSVLEGWWL